jgi:hypothetical protein
MLESFDDRLSSGDAVNDTKIEILLGADGTEEEALAEAKEIIQRKNYRVVQIIRHDPEAESIPNNTSGVN